MTEKQQLITSRVILPLIVSLVVTLAGTYVHYQVNVAKIQAKFEAASKARDAVNARLNTLDLEVKANAKASNAIRLEIEKVRGEQRLTNEKLKGLDEKIDLLLEDGKKRRKR